MYVYSILRGKDLETEVFSEERRIEQFEVLKLAQERVLNLQYWHDFLKAITQAGYRSSKMISSQNNLLFAYILYLIGRTEYGVEEFELRRVIARWFFMSNLTGRYTSSPESAMEFDLIRLREIDNKEKFIQSLERVCEETLTGDFWAIALPNELATSSPRSPSLFAYYASLVLLEAKVLYSDQRVTDLLDPSLHAHRSAIERHHLFPKAHLKTIGIDETRTTNQIANYAFVEWGDNAAISSKTPAVYAPVLAERFKASELERMYYWHALPDGWDSMDYQEFLARRRELIAGVIADGYRLLSPEGADVEEPEPVETLVVNGETSLVEFKSTLRINLHTRKPDTRMEQSCLKTVVGFMNSQGGKLIVGVGDDGSPIGIGEDKFPNEDKMYLHLINLINERIGAHLMIYIHPRFEDYKGKLVLVVDCWPSKSPVFLKDGQTDKFYVRTGVATTELSGSQTQKYIKHRFKGT